MDSGRRRLRAFGSLAGNRALLRVLAAYLLFILTEYAVWIAMLVFAYKRGGTAVAGLAGGYLVQAAAMAGTAAAVGAGSPFAAYAAAVVAATAVTTTRPAQSALIPSLAATPDQLTAANVVAGWLEAAGAAAAGLLVAGLRVAGLAGAEQGTEESTEGAAAGLRLALRQPRLRLMLALLTADAVVLGALDLLVVILALTVLGRPPGWAGYLEFAFGVGAVLAATVSAVLVGRRLGGPILAAALVFSGALA